MAAKIMMRGGLRPGGMRRASTLRHGRRLTGRFSGRRDDRGHCAGCTRQQDMGWIEAGCAALGRDGVRPGAELCRVPARARKRPGGRGAEADRRRTAERGWLRGDAEPAGVVDLHAARRLGGRGVGAEVYVLRLPLPAGGVGAGESGRYRVRGEGNDRECARR